MISEARMFLVVVLAALLQFITVTEGAQGMSGLMRRLQGLPIDSFRRRLTRTKKKEDKLKDKEKVAQQYVRQPLKSKIIALDDHVGRVRKIKDEDIIRMAAEEAHSAMVRQARAEQNKRIQEQWERERIIKREQNQPRHIAVRKMFEHTWRPLWRAMKQSGRALQFSDFKIGEEVLFFSNYLSDVYKSHLPGLISRGDSEKIAHTKRMMELFREGTIGTVVGFDNTLGRTRIHIQTGRTISNCVVFMSIEYAKKSIRPLRAPENYEVDPLDSLDEELKKTLARMDRITEAQNARDEKLKKELEELPANWVTGNSRPNGNGPERLTDLEKEFAHGLGQMISLDLESDTK